MSKIALPAAALSLAALSLATSACGPQQAPPNAAAEPAVHALLAAKDAAAIGALLTDDVVLIDGTDRVDGKQAAAARLAGRAIALQSDVDSHHDVLRALVHEQGAKMLFGALTGAKFRVVALVDKPADGAPNGTQQITDYQDAWNTSDEAKRFPLLENAWADGGRYVDPTADVTGRDALNKHITDFLQNTPGARIDGTSRVFESSSAAHFRWVTKALGGAVTINGMDFGLRDSDGKLVLIAGFFGDLNPK